jgi:hypothetical protein
MNTDRKPKRKFKVRRGLNRRLGSAFATGRAAFANYDAWKQEQELKACGNVEAKRGQSETQGNAELRQDAGSDALNVK